MVAASLLTPIVSPMPEWRLVVWTQDVLEYVNLPVLKRMASQLGLRGVSSARKAVVIDALRETLPYTPLSVVIGFQEQLPPDKLQYVPSLTCWA